LTRAYLALGSNLGDRRAFLQGAVDTLAQTAGIDVIACSRVYETAPVGGPQQGDYLNAVVAVETDLDPWALLQVAHECEENARRVRNVRFGPRTLDVDILCFGELSLDEPDLTIPHPRMWERGFVLVPLREIAPELRERIDQARGDASDPWPDIRIASVALEVPPVP
jgi:2-amino-4-hydroxy-6-hydroxymethyldihydropteridine diphosphokinase